MIPQETLMVVLLFVIRLGVPIAVTLLVVWGLRRMDIGWLGNWATARPLPTAACEAGPDGVTKPSIVPCWVFKSCSEESRAKCDVYQAKAERCWLCKLQRDGRLPSQCRTCGYFAATTLAPVPVTTR